MQPLSALTQQMRRLEQHGDALKFVWLIAKHKNNLGNAGHEAEGLFPRTRVGEMIRKTSIGAADTTSSGWASELAYLSFIAELTSILNAGSLLSLPWRRVPFMVRTLRESTPGSAAWVAEGAPIPASRMSLATVDVERTKIAGMAFFTDESLASWNSRTSAMLNQSLVNVVGRYVDTAFLSPQLAAVAGKNPASLTAGLTPIASPAATEAAVTTALQALLQARVDGGSDLRNVVLCMAPQTALKLSTLLTSGNTRAYPGLGVRGGDLFGTPVYVTPGAASVGSPTENVVAAIDPTRVAVADDGDVQFSASSATSVQMSDSPGTGAQNMVSMWQTGTTALKFVRWLNFENAGGAGAAGYFTTPF